MAHSIRERRVYIQYLVLMLPALIIYTLFHVWPILQGVSLSMTNALAGSSSADFVGLKNFSTLLLKEGPLKEIFSRSFFWTLIFWIGNWSLNILLGLGFALVLFEKIKFQKTFLIIIFLPFVVSNLAMGYIIRMILDPSNGALNWLLLKLNLLEEPAILLKEGWSASITLIIITGWKFTGFNVALFLAGLVLIPGETLEAAVIAGCTYWQKFIRIMVPQMWPTIISISVFCLTGTWQLFALPVALSGTSHGSIKSIDTIAVVFYRWAFGREGFGMASALMFIVASFLFLGSIGFQYVAKKKTVDY